MMDESLRALTTYPQAHQQQQEDRLKGIPAAELQPEYTFAEPPGSPRMVESVQSLPEGQGMSSALRRRAIVRGLALFMGVGLLTLPAGAKDLVQLGYPGFTLWMDRGQRGPVVAYYEVGPDTGNIDTKGTVAPVESGLNLPAALQG